MTDLALPPSDSDLTAEFLASHAKSPLTALAYRRDLDAFSRFSGLGSPQEAARALFALSHGDANRAAQRWISAMEAEGLAPATVRRRVCALRALVAYARRCGKVAWTLEVRTPRVENVRDCRGIPPARFKELLRDSTALERAVFDVLGGAGLRAAEACALRFPEDVAVDAKPPCLRIVGKGKTEPMWWTIPARTAGSVRAWIEQRGTEPGLLFGLDYAKLRGLCGRRKVRAHQLRHAFLTACAKATKGDAYAIAAAGRHASIQTSMRYVDSFRDRAGAVLRLVAGEDPEGDGG